MRQVRLFSSVPIVAALAAADPFVAKVILDEQGHAPLHPIEWQPDTAKSLQQLLFTDLHWFNIWEESLKALDYLSAQELTALASWDVKDINEELERKGLDFLKLRPWAKDRSTFGMVSVLNIMRLWDMPVARGYGLGDLNAAGIRIANDGKFVRVLEFAGNYDIVLPTEPTLGQMSPITARIIRADAELEPIGMYRALPTKNRQARLVPPSEIPGIILPQWTVSEATVDVSSLLGLSGKDGGEPANRWRLVQAKMGGEASFGYAGFKFKAGFAAAMSRECGMKRRDPEKGDLVVNYNHLMAFGIGGVYVPLGLCWVPTESFATEDVHLTEEAADAE